MSNEIFSVSVIPKLYKEDNDRDRIIEAIDEKIKKEETDTPIKLVGRFYYDKTIEYPSSVKIDASEAILTLPLDIPPFKKVYKK